MNTTSPKRFRIGLVPKLLIAIALGTLFGSFAPEVINRTIITPNVGVENFRPSTISIFFVSLHQQKTLF